MVFCNGMKLKERAKLQWCHQLDSVDLLPQCHPQWSPHKTSTCAQNQTMLLPMTQQESVSTAPLWAPVMKNICKRQKDTRGARNSAGVCQRNTTLFGQHQTLHVWMWWLWLQEKDRQMEAKEMIDFVTHTKSRNSASLNRTNLSFCGSSMLWRFSSPLFCLHSF